MGGQSAKSGVRVGQQAESKAYNELKPDEVKVYHQRRLSRRKLNQRSPNERVIHVARELAMRKPATGR